jgi:hypothetical protein
MSNTSCKGGSRQSPSSSSNFSLRNLNGIINIILNVFKIPEKPAESIPPPLIMLGAALRPGLSAKSIASRIISRQSEAGRVTGDVFASGPNTEETMELIRIEEITNALKTEAVVNIVVPPGVPTATVGVGNLGAPVIANGFTTGPSVGQGIIS